MRRELFGLILLVFSICLPINANAIPMIYSYEGQYFDDATRQIIGALNFQFQFDADKLKQIPDGGGTFSNAFTLISSNMPFFFGNPGDSGNFFCTPESYWDGFGFKINNVNVFASDGRKSELGQLGHYSTVALLNDEHQLVYLGNATITGVEPIPEPSTILLLGSGLIGLGLYRENRRKA